MKVINIRLFLAIALLAKCLPASADTQLNPDFNTASLHQVNPLQQTLTDSIAEYAPVLTIDEPLEIMPLFRYRPPDNSDSRPVRPDLGIRQRGTTVYSEGFEPGNTSGDLPANWEVKRNTAADGGLNGNNLINATGIIWFRNSGSLVQPIENWEEYVFTGDASMIISYQASDFTWAISPEIALPGDDLLELSFWMWYNNTDPTIFHLTIFADGNWSTLQSWIEEPSNLFDTQIIIDLSAYAGKNVKLGFVHVNNNGYEVAIDDILITADTEDFLTWTGDVSSDWNDPDNWNSAVPLAADNVLIPAGLINYPVITGNDTCNDLTIAENALFTIAAGGTFTVNGLLSNLAGSSGMLLQSDGIATDASLIHFNSGVEASVERFISGSSFAWHQLSSPVEQQQIITDFHEAGDRLFVWHEPAQVWVSVSNTTVWPTWSDANPGDDFITGKGYLAGYPHSLGKSNPTKTFEGVLNQGEVSFGISRQAHPDDTFTGFNLVGNPYSSAIDWESATGWDRSALVNDGGYSYWVWNDSGSGNYGVYITGGTGTNGVSQHIAPMQGFWVEASATGLLMMDNEVRTHAAQLWLKEEPADILRLEVTSNKNFYSDEVVFIFGKQSDAGGAKKMFSMLPAAPGLYTPKNDKNYSISFLKDVNDYSTLPLAFKPGEDALFTLSLNTPEGFDNVSLEDLKMGHIHDFSKFPDYHFSASAEDDENRFFLHFSALGSEQELTVDRFHFHYSAGELTFVNPWHIHSKMSVLDLHGRLIHEEAITETGIHRLNIYLPPGIYLLQMVNDNQISADKILAR